MPADSGMTAGVITGDWRLAHMQMYDGQSWAAG